MQKDRHFNIRLSEPELRKLRRSASRAGLSMSAYMRSLISVGAEGGIIRLVQLNVDEAKLGALLHEMKKQGTNLNQIAYKLNAQGDVDATELHAALELHAETALALSSLIDGLRPRTAGALARSGEDEREGGFQ